MCTYRTTLDHVLFTVLDNKLLNKLSKQYKKKVDELFNKMDYFTQSSMITPPITAISF